MQLKQRDMINHRKFTRSSVLFLILLSTGRILFTNAQNGWEQMTDIPTPRAFHRSVAHYGKIYVIAGGQYRNPPWLTSNDVYNIETEEWSVLASMDCTQAGLTAGIIDNKIYAFEGVWSYTHQFSDIKEYDIVTNTWFTKSRMPEPRFNHVSEVIVSNNYELVEIITIKS